MKHRAPAPLEPVPVQRRDSADLLGAEPTPPPAADAPAKPPPTKHQAAALLEPVPAQRRDSADLFGAEPAPPPAADELAKPPPLRRRDAGKQTLLGVAPPAAGSHSPSLPNVAGGPLPGPAPAGPPRRAEELEEEPTAQLSTGQLADVIKAAKTSTETAPQGQPAASTARLAEIQLPVPPGALAPEGAVDKKPPRKPDVPGTAMIAAAIAEAAAAAPTASEAVEAAATDGVDDKVEGTKVPVPMLHDQRVSKVVHPRAPTSSRFGVGFLAGVGTTLGSVAIGALVVALIGGKVPGWSSDSPAQASAEPSSGGAVTAGPVASANPPAKPQAGSSPSASPVPEDTKDTVDAGADAQDAEEPPADKAQSSTPAPARATPVFRPRPKPRRTSKYIPDDI